MNELYIKIPRSILINNQITTSAKSLYGLIMVLSTNGKKCYANNSYLSKELNISTRTITSNIKLLKDNDLIEVVYIQGKRLITTVK